MNNEIKQDIYKVVRWYELREYRLRANAEKTKEENDIHYYIKSKYGIRMFETNGDKILDTILENE